MNTTAHAIINSVILGKKAKPYLISAVIVGSLLPDLPMILFYAWQRLVSGADESDIWSNLYYQEGWQTFFDVFNSIPIALAGLVTAFLFKKRWITLFFAGMLLHAFGDLPFHQEDAHRHFFPFSDWRYFSPISYWNPNHHGALFSILEAIAVFWGIIYLVRKYREFSTRLVFLVLGGIHLSYWGFAFVMWM